MTSAINISGQKPLFGTIEPSGSTFSAVKLLAASLFTDEEVTLDNVPKVKKVEDFCDAVKSLGADVKWISSNKILINTSGINSYTVNIEKNKSTRSLLLLGAPLLYRYGQAILPKFDDTSNLNNILGNWHELGVSIQENHSFYKLKLEKSKTEKIALNSNSRLATDIAILSCVFASGESLINNAAEDPEVDDLIEFLNLLGGQVERLHERAIKINGVNRFKKSSFFVQTNKDEVVIMSIASIITQGNVVIENVNKTHLAPFVNVLNKLGCKYEFTKSQLKVWGAGEITEGINLSAGPFPQFLTDWLPALIVLLTQSLGESVVSSPQVEKIPDFIQSLNNMHSDIRLTDSTVSIKGGLKLKAKNLNITHHISGTALVLAALTAEGTSQITGWELIEYRYENFISKLKALGANIF